MLHAGEIPVEMSGTIPPPAKKLEINFLRACENAERMC